MNLIEETQVPEAALPVDALKAHLRAGTGFAEDTVQDAVLASFLRAALAAIEGRTGKALLTRGFVLHLAGWRNAAGQILPVAPVGAVTRVDLLDAEGTASEVDASRYKLEPDWTAPKLVPTGACLPAPVVRGAVEVRFEAGYGPAFADLPADLQQAVFLLAAHYYEYRDETALGDGCMPFGVTALIARYRTVRAGMAL